MAAQTRHPNTGCRGLGQNGYGYPPTPWDHLACGSLVLLLSEKPALEDLRARRSYIYSHLLPPTPIYSHLRRLVTAAQISMKIIQLLLYVPANIQYFTFRFCHIIKEMINCCNTHKLKRSLSIMLEIVAIDQATKNYNC